jgi:hypothetical protein
MLTSNRLRIDSGNGSPAVDYRIESGFVESRILETDAARTSVSASEKQWHRLTPEQLTSRVTADKAVAKWLMHRMGLHRLVRACSRDSTTVVEGSHQTAA